MLFFDICETPKKLWPHFFKFLAHNSNNSNTDLLGLISGVEVFFFYWSLFRSTVIFIFPCISYIYQSKYYHYLLSSLHDWVFFYSFWCYHWIYWISCLEADVHLQKWSMIRYNRYLLISTKVSSLLEDSVAMSSSSAPSPSSPSGVSSLYSIVVLFSNTIVTDFFLSPLLGVAKDDFLTGVSF